MTEIILLLTQQKRVFPVVYDCLWRVQFFAEDPTDFRKVAREFHRAIQRTNVHTRRKGSEADIVYLDTNYRCMLAFSTRENVDLEAMRLRVRAKLREIGKRLAVVAYLGKPNLWKMYLIPEIEREVMHEH